MDSRLLARYVSDSCTPAEQQRVEQWLGEDAAHRRRLRELQKVWQAAAADASVGETTAAEREALWRRLEARAQRADASRSSRARPPRPSSRAKRPRRLSRSPARRASPRRGRAAGAVVAGLLLFVGLAYGLWAGEGRRRAAGGAAGAASVETTPGQRKRVQLTDGTVVRLAAGSRLDFPTTFADSVRRVRLRGQAFFDVQTDAARPFVVEAAPGRVRVLGTRFGVTAYAGDTSGVQVAVREGRVALVRPAGASPPRSVVLSKGEAGRLTATGQLRTADTTAAALAWLQGRLLFRDVPFAQALRQLERWYGFDGRLAAPSLSERRLTATFAGESLDEVLGVLRLSLHVRAERVDSTVVFYEDPPRNER